MLTWHALSAHTVMLSGTDRLGSARRLESSADNKTDLRT